MKQRMARALAIMDETNSRRETICSGRIAKMILWLVQNAETIDRFEETGYVELHFSKDVVTGHLGRAKLQKPSQNVECLFKLLLTNTEQDL